MIEFEARASIARGNASLKVLTPSGYPSPFCFDLGQRNANISPRRLIRGARFLPWLDAITLERGSNCDLLHTLNAVPILTKKPYVVTFESYLPRVPDDRYFPALEKFLFKRLISPQCRRIIAFSEYALGQFRAQISRYPGFEGLLDKTEVLYPAIAPRRSEPKYPPMDELRLLFVGRQFMHKGGPAVVRAHERLLRMGVPVDTIVVSSLDWDRGLVGPDSKALVEGEHARLQQPGIRHIERLDNEGVLRLVDGAHFVLLPTVNDTFGFSCLEALASGTPVIASDTCALPEIVEDRENGFLLVMPNDERGRWIGLQQRRSGNYDDLYLSLIDHLADQIVDRLAELWGQRSDYPALSAQALETVERKFNPTRARQRLERIYEDAVS